MPMWCRSGAGWVCSTRAGSLSEHRLNKAADEAIVAADMWSECLTGRRQRLAAIVANHWAVTSPAVVQRASSATQMSVGIMQLIERSLGYHCHNHLHTGGPVWAQHFTAAHHDICMYFGIFYCHFGRRHYLVSDLFIFFLLRWGLLIIYATKWVKNNS